MVEAQSQRIWDFVEVRLLLCITLNEVFTKGKDSCVEVLHFQRSLFELGVTFPLNGLNEGWINNLETLMGPFHITSPLAIILMAMVNLKIP